MHPAASLSRSAWMAGVACVVALLASSALAQTYQVKVNANLNGLDVKIEPVSTTAMLVVNLKNAGPQRVRCEVKFDPSPQVPSRKTVFLDPGEKGSATLRATRKWFDVDVDVDCGAAPGK